MFNPGYSSSSPPTYTTSSRGEKDGAKYKGVRLRKWGKWVSEIRLPNSRERIWLGSYDCAEKAARAFDAAQFCLRGRNAKFNFEGSRNIDPPNGRIFTPAEIQEFASRYGNNLHDGWPNGNDGVDMNNSAEVDDDLESLAMEVETFPVLSNADGWPLLYEDNIYEPNIIQNHHHDIVTSSWMTTSGVDSGIPDYNLMLSSLDHLQEDMYMMPHQGNRFYDGSQDDQPHVDEHHYSQHSFLWSF